MKTLYSFCFVALLLACTPKQNGSEATNDSTAAVALDTAAAQPTADTTTVAAQAEPVAEIKEEKPKEDPNKKTLKCKFKTVEAGDCMHILFDCGDFGDANTSSLSADQLKLWDDLITFEGHGDYPGANAKYVGKTFEIVHTYFNGKKCTGLESTQDAKLPNIISFKLVN